MSRKDWSGVGKAAFLYSQHLDGYVQALADWVECQALTRAMATCDKTILKSALKMDPWVSPSSRITITHDQLAEEVFGELAQRSADYSARGYPFECNSSGRVLKYTGCDPFPYVFLLALSYTDPSLRPAKNQVRTGGYILEALAWIGLTRFIGEPPSDIADLAGSHHFGRPSLSGLHGRFDKKIDALAKQFNEGRKYKPAASGHVQTSGDNGVDVLLRRGFPDRRGAQFLMFGGCAGGKDWSTTKRYECDPARWLNKNFHSQFVGFKGMARCYFLPRQVSDDHWGDTAEIAGMIIDRCRLSLITHKSGSPHLTDAKRWTEAMYQRTF